MLKIIPLNELKTETDFIINLDLTQFEDAAGNKGDTIYTLKFSTITGLDFTGVSGSLPKLELNKNLVLLLQNSANKESVYKINISSSKFEFQRVEPGNYQLWCFADEDSSGLFNYGWAQPFKPSEKFYFYPDTLNLKPRWVVTDILFNFE